MERTRVFAEAADRHADKALRLDVWEARHAARVDASVQAESRTANGALLGRGGGNGLGGRSGDDDDGSLPIRMAVPPMPSAAVPRRVAAMKRATQAVGAFSGALGGVGDAADARADALVASGDVDATAVTAAAGGAASAQRESAPTIERVERALHRAVSPSAGTGAGAGAGIVTADSDALALAAAAMPLSERELSRLISEIYAARLAQAREEEAEGRVAQVCRARPHGL